MKNLCFRLSFLLALLVLPSAHAGATFFQFQNGAGVQVTWGAAGAGIFYLAEDEKTIRHIGDAKVFQVSAPPQEKAPSEIPKGVALRTGAAGEPVLLTIESASLQTPNKKSTLAIFPDGTAVNYPIDAFDHASFGTAKAGSKWILGAAFEKSTGTKVYLSPNPAPIREEGKIPNLVAIAIQGTKVLDRKALVDWKNTSVVTTDPLEKVFDLRVGEPNADPKADKNDVSLIELRSAREELARVAVSVAGRGVVNPEPGIQQPTPPPPVVDAQLSAKIEFKDGKLSFKGKGDTNYKIVADYARAIEDSQNGILTAISTFEHKETTFTLLKIFHTKEGNADGELFIIREDGEMVRFGFKSLDAKPRVENGILSVAGTERQIDLDRFDIEATRQSMRPTALKDTMNNALDPIAEVKNLFRDLSAQARQGAELPRLLPSQTKYIDEKLRPAAAQEGGGSIVVYGTPGIGTQETVQAFVDNFTQGNYPEIPRTWRALQLDAGALGSGTGLVGATATREQAIVEFSREIPCYWIALDFSALKGVGSSSGDDSGSLSRLAPHIENGTMQMIALTSTPGYTASIATDPRMRNLFQPAEMVEGAREEIIEALVRWMEKFKKPVPPRDSAEYKELEKNLGYVIDVSSEFDAANGQPRKAERLFKTLFAQKRVRGETGPITRGDIERAAISLYQADKSLFDPVLRAEKLGGLQAHLDEELTGLTYAKKVAVQGYANVFTRVNRNRTPRNKALFGGPPGTGKSATVELSAAFIKLPKTVLEMNSYVTQESLEQFLFDVASALRTNGYTILILDEIEKAHYVVQSAALRMMQNGEFSARDSMADKTSSRSNVQTSNASFQFTTNAGEDYVMDCYLGNKTYSEADYRKVLAESGINSAILDRIDKVVPVGPFSKKTFRKALDRAIGKFQKEYAATAGAAQVPLNLSNKEEFLDALVDLNFEEGEKGLPKKDAEGGRKLVNGRLVNRILLEYLQEPTAYQRSMSAHLKCVDLVLTPKTGTEVYFD